jgi:WhiB family redox-sensing transcriptional regulator
LTAVTPLRAGEDGLPPALLRPPLSLLSWTGGPACRGRTDLFFAPHAERRQERERREAEARALCLACAVLEPCRQWARKRREYGFWGGESEEERAAAGYPPALPVGRVAQVSRARWETPWTEEERS